MNTLRLLLRFDTVCNESLAFRCSSLICDERVVSDHETKCLMQITKDGRLKATVPYDVIPHRANLFANTLVVSVQEGVSFYQL